jgi:glycosyltransferase involved in cell wall biosynthesis
MKKVSCVIHTYNAETYLKKCLESVRWCDQLVIVDMFSTDKTVDIAKEYGAEIYLHENLGYADPARAYGLNQCKNEWVLAIDSDEIVPKKLAKRLIEIAEKDEADVVRISFRNFFFGKEIKGAGWGYKDQVIQRFFKKIHMKYGSEVHNFVNITENSRVLKIVDKKTSIIHFNYDSVEHFINKLNNYTSHETQSTKFNYKGRVVKKLAYHFIRELIGRFIIKKGYKDGWIGLYLSLGMVFYRWTAVAKANTETREGVIKKYNSLDHNAI